MKKVLITGISGFAGGFLAERLISDGNYDITGTYYSSKPQLLENTAVKLREIDLGAVDSVAELVEEVKPDSIVHLAAMTSPAESFGDPVKTITNNVVGEINLLEAVRKLSLHETRIIIVSSADVYGIIKPEDVPIDEETPFRPSSPYGVSKITQDYLGLQYFFSYKLNIVRVRPFNHIGPRQSDRFAIASFAKQIAEIEQKKQDPVIKVGNLDAKKDFTDVRDIVRAYELLLEKGEAGEAYNLGSGHAYKVEDLLQKLLSYSDIAISVERDPKRMRPSDTPLLICNNEKLKKATGWEPEIGIDTTLKSTLDYWRSVV